MKNNHTAFKLFAFLTITILLFGCTDAYKVPNQSVFELLNARQIKRAFDNAGGFDEFYDNYAWMLAKCDDQIKVEFADVTWRDFYKYYINNYINNSGYYKYRKSWEKNWRQRFGQYDEKVDSVIASYDQRVRDYFAQFLNVEFVEIENDYHPLSKEIEKTRFAFKLTAVCDTITECSFKLWRMGFLGMMIGKSSQTFTTTTLVPSYSSVIPKWTLPYPMKGNYDSFMVNKEDYLKDKGILIIDVMLQNGMKYSIYDFDMPESIRSCILSGFSAGYSKTAAWEQVFEDLYGFSYEEGSDYYKNMSKYISGLENQWIENNYYREKLLDDRLYGRR